MQLDYSILWIEDDSDFVDSVKEEIKDFVGSKGFVPEIRLLKKDELTTLSDEILKNYDLILIDYKLSNNSYSSKSGEKLIEAIRQMKLYNNIIFYSSEVEKIKSFNLPGVFVLDRTSIVIEEENDFCSMITFFLEKGMNFNTMRGIAMSEVAAFDRKIIKFLDQHCDKEEMCSKVKEKFLKSGTKTQKMSTEKLWAKIMGPSGTVYFQSTDRSDYFFHKNPPTDPEISETYQKVLKGRNKLAHQESVDMDFVEYRKQLITIRNYLKKLS